MQCIQSVTYSILINGSPTKPFETRRGLRQGDPLSPFLFVLAMEYFTRSRKKLQQIPDFNYHPRCEKMHIMQLSFADDLLLFCRGDSTSVKIMYECFLQFSKASGLKVNKRKSFVFFGGVHDNVQQEILENLGFEKGELPVRYLGVPSNTKRLTATQCQP